MTEPSASLRFDLRALLKRGLLIVAANWQVVLVQFLAESTFKLLLAVPIVCGVIVVALVLGGSVRELMAGDLRETLALSARALLAQPVAFTAFMFAVALVLFGGSALMFLVKGGTVATIAEAEAAAGAIERAPLRLSSLERAARASIDGFVNSARRLFPRYLLLGLLLLAVYGLSGAAYLGVVFGSYRLVGEGGIVLAWTLVAAVASGLLVAWILAVNLFYLLTQMVIAMDDRPVVGAIAQAWRFLRAARGDILSVFFVILALVAAALVASTLATTGLGLIAFVPFAGLAVFPLQIAAWLARGLVFQFLGLGALAAYVTIYRARREPAAGGSGPGGAEVPGGSGGGSSSLTAAGSGGSGTSGPTIPRW